MDDLDFSQTGLALPALKGTQGGRTLYVALPSNSVLNNFFPVDLEPAEDKSQRSLDPRHARDISEYMTANASAYSLGAVTYAIDKEGIFQEASNGSGIGILRLPLDARLRSIDGQHRREGIRMAIEVLPALARESTALLLYVEPDLARRRQMFADMNNTAKRVSKAVSISFDSRDPFARAVNEIADTHPLLRNRVEKTSIRVAPGSGKLFTLGAIHDAVKRLFVGPAGRVKDPYKYSAENIAERGNRFFDLLAAAKPILGNSESDSETLLYSSTTLRVIAGAVWKLSFDEETSRIPIETLADPLSAVDFSPTHHLWLDAGYVTPGSSTPNARSQEVLAATESLAASLSNRSNQR